MNFSKIIRVIAITMGIIGCILIWGSASTTDYCVEMEIYKPFWETALMAVSGFLMIGSSIVILGFCEDDFGDEDDEWEDWDDEIYED